MARQNLGSHFFPFVSGADYSDGSGAFRFVKHAGTLGVIGTAAGNGQDPAVIRCTVAGELAMGILQDRPKTNETATVLVLNAPAVAKIVAGAANIANGAVITTDTTGRAIVATTGNYGYGIALNTAGTNAVGDLIEVLIGVLGKQ